MVHGSQGPSPTESSLPEYLVSMCSFEVLRCTISPVNSQLALWKSGKLELSRTLILFFCNLKRNKDIESKTRQIKTKKHSSGDSRPVTPSSIEKGRQGLSSSKSRLGCGKMFSKNSGKASWCPLCIYLFLFFCCDQTTWKHPSLLEPGAWGERPTSSRELLGSGSLRLDVSNGPKLPQTGDTWTCGRHCTPKLQQEMFNGVFTQAANSGFQPLHWFGSWKCKPWVRQRGALG